MAKEIELTKGQVALVDDSDFGWLDQWSWYCSDGKYAARRARGIKGRPFVLMHRQIMGLDAADGRKTQVDHCNYDTFDNRRANLRVCTASENCHNNRPKGGVSQFIGVATRWNISRFRAYITVYGRQMHLGYFATEEEAARVRDEAALRLYGEFATLNFPDSARKRLTGGAV